MDKVSVRTGSQPEGVLVDLSAASSENMHHLTPNRNKYYT